MLKAIPCALRRHQFAKIEFPDATKMVEWAKMIEMCESMATDIIGFMDGLSLHSKCSSGTYEQNAMYNGYHSDTIVHNVFASGANGKVFLCCLNFPGSCLDGSFTVSLHPIIIEKLVLLRYLLIKVFSGVVMRIVFWLDLIVKDQLPDFPQFSVHIYRNS